MTNRVDPDVTAYYEPFYLDLHCLQKYFVLVYRAEKVNCGTLVLNPTSSRFRVGRGVRGVGGFLSHPFLT